MNVIVLAWGPSLPTNFAVEGHGTSTDEQNFWAGLVPVSSAAANVQPALRAGSVPYTVYAPGNNPAVLAGTLGGSISSSGNPVPLPTAPPGSVPTTVPGVPGAQVPPPPIPGSGAVQPQSIHISPYADVHYRLPASIKPGKLSLVYDIARSSPIGDLDLLAYNVTTGSWDKVGTLQTSGATKASHLNGTLSVPNPAGYTGSGGDVYIRILPKGGDTTLTGVTLNLELNGK
jgi:hypothetical protein